MSDEYAHLLVKDFGLWGVYVHENQSYLGRCVTALTHVSSLTRRAKSTSNYSQYCVRCATRVSRCVTPTGLTTHFSEMKRDICMGISFRDTKRLANIEAYFLRMTGGGTTIKPTMNSLLLPRCLKTYGMRYSRH